MSMPSHTSVGVVALDSAGKKRLRHESYDRPTKKLRGWPIKLSSSSQSTSQALQSSNAGSAAFNGKIRPNSPPDDNSTNAETMMPNLTTGVNSITQHSASLYRHSVRIPDAIIARSKLCVYVFPGANACISMDHYNRFPVIMDIFRQNLQEFDKIALKHPAKTEYILRMCGTSMETAKPSILIYHPQVDKKTGLDIVKFLSRPQIREQYCSNNMMPRFDIHWFSGPAFGFCGRSMDGFGIQMQNSYIPGALLSDDAGERISTLTCGIRFPNVDDAIFLLTTAHAFEEDDGSSESDTEYVETSATFSNALNEDEEENGNVYRFGDVEYDITELENYDNVDEQGQWLQVSKQHKDLSRHIQGQSNGRVHTTKAKVAISPNRVWGRSQEPKWENYPNLDWALIETEKSGQWKADKLDLALYDIPGVGYQNRDVKVITSRGPLSGTISSIPSYIANSNKLSALCKVWSVSLEDSSQISVGDSGALVIDTLTEKPYGYVIGINYFQELYVISLHSVLEQISQMMPISIGNPEIFMALVPRSVPSLVPKDDKESRLQITRHLSQYWARTEAHSMNTSFYEAPRPVDDSFNTANSESVYFDCPTSPIPIHPSEEETQLSVPSLTTSFTSDQGRTQSPPTQLVTGIHQKLNNSIDCRIYSLNSCSQSFEDGPPSSYETALLELSVEKDSPDPKSKTTDDESDSPPVSPK